ncbi:unnamed protein product [Kuraishia capsulata CBS 1993]|uniref:S-adenosyl-L-methionine-dependent tRNA 4-demethylwyosine synthase n=1 Tax=Kuraishia capsulata CBS 1993 TaxID=1382522 RepID=W6MPN5_9ASCO|nr:uncharacterized protein KUCA_T00004663001 [Kuraishia capsulata CBS 1993]CDK28679.1 unnamed protein product [Kuraishia capsulata CBS 1993]
MAGSTIAVGAGCAVLYLLNGGRWSVTLLILLAFIFISSSQSEVSSESHKTNETGKPKSPPQPDELAMDFTTVDFAAKTKPTFRKAPDATKVVTEGAVSLKKSAKRVPKVIKATRPVRKSAKEILTKSHETLVNSNIIIFYTSLTGASERTARRLYEHITSLGLTNKPQILNLDEDVDDLDDYFVNVPKKDQLVYILVLPSYETDSPIDYFLDTLQETANDFRVDKYPLKKLAGFAVLGLGDSESWPEKFCYQAQIADKRLSALGGRRIFPVGTVCIKTGGELKVDEWIRGLGESITDDEPFVFQEMESDDEDEDSNASSEDTLIDVEDITKGFNVASSDEKIEIKQMVAKDSPTYKSLTKQGYTVVGSHSGVKICRWTKSALRGRGSCYKFAFYGIRSHLCMETTPSLSCSNKCVFCWRHGTNPVGTTWRWQVDEPDVILKGALEGHYKKIKQMRGVPGVDSDRFNEAFTVRHCALSLVGEPIFYPHINEFVGMLHAKHISSFLVCNAQHPDQLKALNKVTQLYVSIDAANKNELKRVDRPLYKDYWDRLQKCLEILSTTQLHQRTVFRLTLVKGFNMGEVEGYADMVEKGLPSLIEIKGATFCGSSSGNGNPLTMQNIPFYEECQNFVRALNKEVNSRGLEYDIAAEHAHSCCILIAQKKFQREGKWYTHIDYKRFFELLESGEEFTDMDYIAPTPEWAYWGSEQAGFNPQDQRFNRKEEKLKRKLAMEV